MCLLGVPGGIPRRQAARPGQLLPPGTPAPAHRGTDYAELSRQIRAARLLDRRPRYYAWKITVTAVLLAAGWAVFAVLGDSWWQLAVAAFLAVMFTQVGFLGHDAGHRQIFRSRPGNHILGVLLGNLGIGLSYGWWVSKHNRHHAHPNQEGADPDIVIGALAFTESQAHAGRGLGRLTFRYQAFLFFPLLLLEAVSLHVASIRALISRPSRYRAWEAGLLAVHVAGYLTVVFLVLSPVMAVAFIVVQQGLFGLYLGASFAPNHKGMPILDAGRPHRLPAPPGAHLPQRPRRLAHRPRPGRPELPDRAPPVPLHAPAQPAPLPGDDQGVLRAAGPALLRDQPGRLLRPGPALPQRRRPVSPPLLTVF